MTVNVEKCFASWLQNTADIWGCSVQDVALKVAEEEVMNRVIKYPILQKILKDKPFNIQRFAATARGCWVLGGQNDSIRFNAFVNNTRKASEIIEKLIRSFPEKEHDTIVRVNNFLEEAVLLGFSTPKETFDWAGALQTASLILTALFPNRFPDYRKTRWKKIANEFGYSLPPKGSSHGEWLIWAGNFGNAIASTKLYRELWPKSEKKLAHPLWVISGICWVGLEPKKPEQDPYNPDDQYFSEGAKKRRLHLYRERNRAVVSKAKESRLKIDPFLHCEVCGFSFVKKYGLIGEGFIEAHHKIPLFELKEGGRTRVEDIALLCSNCHRMIHAGEKTSTLSELHNSLNSVNIAQQSLPGDG